MAGLEVAVERLSTALDDLERALAPVMESRKRQAHDAEELASLAREREGLLARIAALEANNRALGGLAEEVEGRLDCAISDIHAVLGR